MVHRERNTATLNNSTRPRRKKRAKRNRPFLLRTSINTALFIGVGTLAVLTDIAVRVWRSLHPSTLLLALLEGGALLLAAIDLVGFFTREKKLVRRFRKRRRRR